MKITDEDRYAIESRARALLNAELRQRRFPPVESVLRRLAQDALSRARNDWLREQREDAQRERQDEIIDDVFKRATLDRG